MPDRSEPHAPVPRGTGASALAALAALIRTSPHNLVSRRGAEELESRHLPECAAFASALPPGPSDLVDIGSGGGLPGLVIALTRPDLRVSLIESTGKKARFLAAAAAALEVDVTVHHGRAEDLGRGPLAASFDLATARAVAPLERLVGWVAPLLRPGGHLHAIKGDAWAEELARARPDLARHGLTVVHEPVADPPSPHPRVVILRAGATETSEAS